jgi:hypothetical protein
MLRVNFILRVNDNDKYIFIINNRELFHLFFMYLNFDFLLREDKELAYIKSNDDMAISKINKNETLCLLVLRLLYQNKMDTISLSDNIEITVKELQEKLFSVGFENNSNERVKKSTLSEMLRVFKRHSIIYYNGDLNMDDTVIIIYPSIEVAMDFKMMDEILTRLDSLKGGEESYD